MTAGQFGRLLTTRRLKYPFILAGILWPAWIASLLLGPGNLDLAGQPVGADYIQFYAAGFAARTGQTSRLYDLGFQWQLQRDLVVPDLQGMYAFITPPHLSWLFVPFSMLPYGLSFALWVLLGIACLWGSFRLLGAHDLRPFVWSLTWYVVYASVSYGQNGLLSLLILSLTYWLWRRDRALLAGLALSLLLYKPQLTLGVLVLWLLRWRQDWKALVGFGLGALAAAALSFAFLPEASVAYLGFARAVLPGLPEYLQFPTWNLHTVRGFWTLLLPAAPTLDAILAAILGLLGLALFVRLWRSNRGNPALVYAAAVCLTWWLTPHAMIYDLAILLIPAYLLWQQLRACCAEYTALLAVAWVATLVSPFLSLLQTQVLPLAFQVSVPVLAIVIWQAFRLHARTQEQTS